MGSATLYHLARRGIRALGIERYGIPNEMGSSLGISKMIRLTYHEHPSYVPLVRRAYELWHQLENSQGERLLVTTGSLRGGTEDSSMFQGSREACEIHNIPCELLSGPEVNRRYPGYQLPEDVVAVYQPDGGFLLSERCIIAHVDGAIELGAEVHGRERVLAWEATGEGARVETDRADYTCRNLVFCAGAWTAAMVPELSDWAIPERQVLAWFLPSQPELFRPDRFPVFGLELDEGRFYGFPSYGVPGFKVGRYHHLCQNVDPDTMNREATAEDEELLRDFTRRYFPLADGPILALKTCMFTNSPDGHFLIDVHPQFPQVSFAAGFSGHGFKFCSVVGEIMTDLVQSGETSHDLDLFRLSRFQGAKEQS
ncbi:MAG: N-methyl-L-tryptophan oxidase [Chloroflexi bacterium]|nr:N-methyl-L-tryptophan oxidase [Chloroflexota bacterium]